jgi:hypothetical protein
LRITVSVTPGAGEVTDDADLRMTRNREFRLNLDAAGALQAGTGRFHQGVSEWRARDARSPKDGASLQSLHGLLPSIAGLVGDAVFIDIRDLAAGVHLQATPA